MEEIFLFTADDGFVAKVYIPPFNKWPDTITWGTRIFGYKRDHHPDGHKQMQYYEGFAVAAFTREQLKQQGITF